MARRHFLWVFLCLALLVSAPSYAQTITATLEGRVTDPSGRDVPQAKVTITNTATGYSRSDATSDSGEYRIPLLPVGEYTVTVEKAGFAKQAKKVTLQIGQVATLDFAIAIGELAERVTVVEEQGVMEPTRTEVSTVITERQIQNLPVNGRQFIDFVLLAPGVSIGDTTSGSTDVIVEPVTKISFAGQNIHYNFVAIDGADNISTASGIQKTTPSQEAVQEFRVINTEFSTAFGRAVGGIVNIITKSGTNELHGSVYSFFRNDAMDAGSILAAPGQNTLHQYQFGAAVGGPIVQDRTFFFANYEGQRRTESPFYNSSILKNIATINAAKVSFGLPAENLNVLRDSNADTFLVKLDHRFNAKHGLSVRHFFNDARFTNVSPLNDGFDLPSAFKTNNLRDNSLVGNLTSAFTTNLVNELRVQWAHRSFDFPVNSTQPHLEVANTFTVGVNRGNPDFYKETRFEIVDSATLIRGRHTWNFGGNFNWVRTTESFPLFYPFEATFATLNDLVNGTPFVIFFERFLAPNFKEPTIAKSVYQGGAISSPIRNQAKGVMDHTYNGFFLQDKIRVTNRLTVNLGVRYEFETWPKEALNNDMNNVDPRVGFAYRAGSKWNLVVRGGAGIFHGTIPSPLLSCQIPSCGGTTGKFPGREGKEDDLNATTRLFAFASAPFITNLALNNLLGQPNLLNPAPTTGTYVDAVPAAALGCPSGFLSSCGFFGDAVIVRFAKDHQAPLSYQMSLSLEIEPIQSLNISASYLRVRGLRLGSFFNVNQPDPSGTVMVHNSQGVAGPKNTYFCPASVCGMAGLPGTRNPNFAVYFEADSRWDSVYDGFFLTVNKRMAKYFSFNTSYTFSKGIDNGPNPSFVLIPQDSKDFRAERALSADDARHRFTGNATFNTSSTAHPVLRDFLFSFILTLESPHRFTKFAGSDVNGDVFGVNDRVGIEPRNTFKGDSLQTFDFRLSRSFPIKEKKRVELIAEVFNAFNKLNVRFFNTNYGAADFCPFNPAAAGCGAGPFFKEGSPNPAYGTPRAIYNPRQIQLAVRFAF
jgi:hypothetical protein